MCSFAGADNRSEESCEVVFASPQRRSSDPTANHRQTSQDDERAQHAPRRFVNVNVMLVKTRLAPEGKEDEAEHVERREQRREQPDEIQGMAAGNFIGAEEDR